MKKMMILAAAAAVLLASCATTSTKGSGIKAKDPKLAIATTEFLDFQGSEMGGEIPQWVKELANGNYGESVLKRVMPDIEGKKTFVTIGYGDNLDFVRQWTDLVDVETEVASTLSRVAAKAVEASMTGNAGKEGNTRTDATAVQQNMDMYRTSLTSVSFSGLEKTAQFWTYYQRVRGKEVVQTPQFAYYAVWTMPQKMFDDQLKVALDRVKTTSGEEEALKDMVRQKLASQLSVASNDPATADAADANQNAEFVVFSE